MFLIKSCARLVELFYKKKAVSSEKYSDFYADLREKGFGPNTSEFTKVTNSLTNKFLNRLNTRVIGYVHHVVLVEFVAPANRMFMQLMESQPPNSATDSKTRVARVQNGIPLTILLSQQEIAYQFY